MIEQQTANGSENNSASTTTNQTPTTPPITMPFPTNPPKQMPCPHWNHFPISPAMQAFGCISGSSPPSPSTYNYCHLCQTQKK